MLRILPAGLLLLAASIAAPGAPPAADRESPGGQRGAPTPKALVPVTASSVAAAPDAYVGQYVTLIAPVDRRFSATAFSVDQDRTKSTGQDVLILAPALSAPVDVDVYITVIGEVVRFDFEELVWRAPDYVIDLPADVVDRYRGRPAILASSVINARMIDLAKRLLPPLTAEEQAYSTVMKQVGPAFASLRQAVTASDAEATTTHTTVLREAFAKTEAFWKARGTTDALEWAQDARRQLDIIQRGAAGTQWEAVAPAAAALGQSCQSCHAAYRERFDDGSYRIKPGTR